MADDETIRIGADTEGARRQVEALEAEVADLSSELDKLKSSAGSSSEEIAKLEGALGSAQEQLAESKQKLGGVSESAEAADLSIKGLTKSIGAGVSIFAVLKENLAALEPVFQRVKDLTIEWAVANGGSKETIDALSLAIDSAAHPTQIFKNALLATAEGMKLLAEKSEGTSEVVVTTTDTITQMLAKIAEAREEHAEAEKQAAKDSVSAKKDEEKAANDLAKEEEALEKAAVKSAEERAKAEAKAAEEVVAALAKQEEAFNKMLADTANYVAERDKILNAPNKGFDGSPDKSGAAKSLAGLKDQIKEIQDSPLVSPEQANQLQDLRRQASEAARAVADLGQVYTLANMNGEELAQKQNAAWEKYYALRHANDAIVQRNVDADLRALGDQNDAVAELADSADSAAGSFGDLADAAGSLGDESKKGAEKGKEGLDKLNEGFTQAIPLAEQLRGILQEIVTLGAQADI